MKKVFNSFLLILLAPFRFLKKSKIDNFVGGLIVGAVFSLVVNVITVQIQETIQRQRILEAIENEILSNTLQAKNTLTKNLKYIDDKTPYNPFMSIYRYKKDLWEQSSEPLQYVAQLNQRLQIDIETYYGISIPYANAFLDNVDEITKQKLINCSTLDNPSAATDEKCGAWNTVRLSAENNTAQDVFKQGMDLLKEFHPTADRLNNWFLRLIMGNESTRILSGK